MVELSVFKNKIQELLNQKVDFYEDKEIVRRITEEKANKIYGWVAKVAKTDAAPDAISRKKYGAWNARDILIFIYRFRIDNEYRILVLKAKNSQVIEIHIGLHSYYDEIRKKLGLAH